MAGYTPAFDTMLTGSLFGKWPHNGIWALLLTRTDRHGHINDSPECLAAHIGIPVKRLMESIDYFMEPDEASRTKEHDGRRLELIDPARGWGWRVINHGTYREKARLMAKSAREVEEGRNAERLRQQHEGTAGDRRSPPGTAADPLSDAEAEANTNANKKKNTTAASRPDETAEFSAFKALYPKRSGDNPWRRALKAIHARLSEGHSWNEILDGASRYQAYIRATGKERTEYVMQACRFCGPDKPFLAPWDLPATKAQLAQDENVESGREWLRRSANA